MKKFKVYFYILNIPEPIVCIMNEDEQREFFATPRLAGLTGTYRIDYQTLINLNHVTSVTFLEKFDE